MSESASGSPSEPEPLRLAAAALAPLRRSISWTAAAASGVSTSPGVGHPGGPAVPTAPGALTGSGDPGGPGGSLVPGGPGDPGDPGSLGGPGIREDVLPLLGSGECGGFFPVGRDGDLWSRDWFSDRISVWFSDQFLPRLFVLLGAAEADSTRFYEEVSCTSHVSIGIGEWHVSTMLWISTSWLLVMGRFITEMPPFWCWFGMVIFF